MSIKIFMTVAFCLVALGACANKNLNTKSIETGTIVKLTPAKQERVTELLLFIDHYSNGTSEVQKKIFTETNQALTENKNDLTQRIKLAVMLSLPSSRIRDTGKAQNLLQDLLQDNSLNPAESALTSLFYEYILDSIKQSQKNKDDLKKLELNQQKYDSLQQKYDVLDKKLNDLKDIEKTMNDRDGKTMNKP